MRFVLIVVAFSALAMSVGASAGNPPRTIAAAQATDDLPDGEGKKILLASCTACHELTEVTKFKGYYTRDEWRDVIKTMVEYGAQIRPADVDVLVEYLDRNFGKKK